MLIFFLQLDVTSDNGPFGIKLLGFPTFEVTLISGVKQFSVEISKLHSYNICVCTYGI
jgi:hypothetical protein